MTQLWCLTLAKVFVEEVLAVKPLSANKMHYGRTKRDTKEYRIYKATIAGLLGKDYGITPKSILKFTLVAGFSNKASDLDNVFKPLLDAMQLCMGFDDKQIYEAIAYKDVVPKGEEYLYVKLESVPRPAVFRKINKLVEDT